MAMNFKNGQIRTGLLLGLICLAATGSVAQDPSMSQFYANPLFMNPAMAGLEGPAKIYLGYRNHWPGGASPYSTYHASYEQFLEPLQGGIGVHVINDRQGGGIFNTVSLDAIYAYHLKVTRQLTVTGGFQASVGQRNMNPDGLVLPDELAGSASAALQGYSKVYPDFALGMGAFYKNLYGGFACHHLLQPYMSPSGDPNTRLSRRYSVHVGAMFPVYEKRLGREVLQMSPNLVFIQQDIYQQVNYGLEVLFRSLLGGIWLRQDLLFSYGTMVFSVGYARDQFRFRYSYDAKLSSPDLHIPSMGAHEISLVVVFENLQKSTKHRAIKSPKI
jgi:type IX secretion system PorP/SprF family membrane protein